MNAFCTLDSNLAVGSLLVQPKCAEDFSLIPNATSKSVTKHSSSETCDASEFIVHVFSAGNNVHSEKLLAWFNNDGTALLTK
jgi:hypothetical protein